MLINVVATIFILYVYPTLSEIFEYVWEYVCYGHYLTDSSVKIVVHVEFWDIRYAIAY